MPSTYTTNNGIEIIATGEQSGTWGDTTNTNLQLLDQSLDGQATVTLASAGSSVSPNQITIDNGALSDGRNRMIIFADGGDLGATAYVQLSPSDAEKIVYIRNTLSGSRSILLFQGTYNASNDYELPAGTTAIVRFDGAGSGAVVSNVFNNAYFDSLRLGGVSVTAILDEDNMASNSATALATQQSIKAYVDAQVTAQDLDFAGDSGTGAVDLDSQSLTIAGTANEIETSASGQTITIGLPTAVTIPTLTVTTAKVATIQANDGTAAGSIANTTGVVTLSSTVLPSTDINGGTIDNTVIGGATPAAVTSTTLRANTNLGLASGVTVSAILDEDNMVSNSATALATQQSIKAYVDSQVTAQDLDFAGDTGTGAVDLDSQSFTISGTANEIETSASGQTITIGLPNAVTIAALTSPSVDINGGNIDGTVIGATTPAAVTTSSLVATTADINAGTVDNTVIGGTTAAAGTFTNLTATGTTTLAGATTSADITFGDNDKAIFGAGSDLQIYHTGSNSVIEDLGTGNLVLQSNGTSIKLQKGTTETLAEFVTDGAVDLYYNNSKRLATTSTGVDITGSLNVTDAATTRTNIDVDQAGTALALSIALG